MTHNELVEALAEWVAVLSGHSVTLRWHINAAEAFVDRHRLVQLPEKPDLTLVTRMVPYEERHIHGYGYAKAMERDGWRITARYMRIPDPIDVREATDD